MTRRGFQTTEFWVVVATNVGILAAALADALPAKYAAIASAVSTAAYAISRGLTKVAPPVVAVTGTVPQSTVPTTPPAA